ncbi:MAG: hypothetical protein HY232_12505 [Acidobacteria bacterium]|nr:hypothetical protein [Acidobacteriota bacterium]
MSSHKNKPTKAREGKAPSSDIRPDLVKAIKRVWPEDVIIVPIDYEESYFWDIYPGLEKALRQITGADLAYERKAHGELKWQDGADPTEDAPDWSEEDRSYHLFFISPKDPSFKFESDTLEPDENDVEQRVAGEGRVGCSVGISILAPYAIIKFDMMETYDSGGYANPDIEPHIFSLEGGEIDLDVHCRDFVGEEGLQVLYNLRQTISTILTLHGLTIIPDEELVKPAPWLQPDEELATLNAMNPLTVRHALFFHEL